MISWLLLLLLLLNSINSYNINLENPIIINNLYDGSETFGFSVSFYMENSKLFILAGDLKDNFITKINYESIEKKESPLKTEYIENSYRASLNSFYIYRNEKANLYAICGISVEGNDQTDCEVNGDNRIFYPSLNNNFMSLEVCRVNSAHCGVGKALIFKDDTIISSVTTARIFSNSTGFIINVNNKNINTILNTAKNIIRYNYGYSMDMAVYYEDFSFIVTGTPFINSFYGQIDLLDEKNMKLLQSFPYPPDKEVGNGFGSSVAIVRKCPLNQNQLLKEWIVTIGAPYDSNDEGSIYFYLLRFCDDKNCQNNVSLDLHNIQNYFSIKYLFKISLNDVDKIKSTQNFGIRMKNVGDLDLNSCDDLEISSRGKNNEGSLFIFYQNESGFSSKFFQRINPSTFKLDKVKHFSFNIDSMDINNDGINDLLIGSLGSVVLLKPQCAIFKTELTHKIPEMQPIILKETKFSCFEDETDKNAKIYYKIEIDLCASIFPECGIKEFSVKTKIKNGYFCKKSNIQNILTSKFRNSNDCIKLQILINEEEIEDNLNIEVESKLIKKLPMAPWTVNSVIDNFNVKYVCETKECSQNQIQFEVLTKKLIIDIGDESRTSSIKFTYQNNRNLNYLLIEFLEMISNHLLLENIQIEDELSKFYKKAVNLYRIQLISYSFNANKLYKGLIRFSNNVDKLDESNLKQSIVLTLKKYDKPISIEIEWTIKAYFILNLTCDIKEMNSFYDNSIIYVTLVIYSNSKIPLNDLYLRVQTNDKMLQLIKNSSSNCTSIDMNTCKLEINSKQNVYSLHFNFKYSEDVNSLKVKVFLDVSDNKFLTLDEEKSQLTSEVELSITHKFQNKIPYWYYLIGSILGLFLLILLVIILYKKRFFRKKKYLLDTQEKFN